MYCESSERRIQFKAELEKEKQQNIDNQNKRIARKQYLFSQIAQIEANPVDFKNEFHSNNIEAPAPRKRDKRLSVSSLSSEQEAEKLQTEGMTRIDEHPSSSSSSSLPSIDTALNAPMVMTFLLRRCQEDPTVLKGLEFIFQHIEKNGEGCQLFYRHGLVTLLCRISEFHNKHKTILLFVLKCFVQLLDCNLTRDFVIDDGKETLVDLLFNILYLNMTSHDHVLEGSRALMQCTRYAHCRTRFVSKNVIPYLFIIANENGMKHYPSFLNSLLRICHWMCLDRSLASYLLEQKVIVYCLKFMKLHSRECLVLIPIIALFRKIILLIPSTLETLIDHQITSLLVHSLEVITNNDEIYLETLKLLQLVSMTSKGWEQISAISGGWQKICQGTQLGNSLVHDLPGHFHNPGWTLGETKYLPELERMKLSAYANLKNSLELQPKMAWTSASLRQYMGLSMSGQTLTVNTEYHDVYFQLLKTLDILPLEAEDRSSWYQRLRIFEKENDVKLEEMCNTVQEMKKREAIQKKLQEQHNAVIRGLTVVEEKVERREERATLQAMQSIEGEYDEIGDFTGGRAGGGAGGVGNRGDVGAPPPLFTVKDVYVAGKKIDGKFLAENDIDMNEAFFSLF
jgi:hypothetical protein